MTATPVGERVGGQMASLYHKPFARVGIVHDGSACGQPALFHLAEHSRYICVCHSFTERQLAEQLAVRRVHIRLVLPVGQMCVTTGWGEGMSIVPILRFQLERNIKIGRVAYGEQIHIIVELA